MFSKNKSIACDIYYKQAQQHTQTIVPNNDSSFTFITIKLSCYHSIKIHFYLSGISLK